MSAGRRELSLYQTLNAAPLTLLILIHYFSAFIVSKAQGLSMAVTRLHIGVKALNLRLINDTA